MSKKIDVDKMTVRELYAAHQELWFWLADNPDEGKEDWPGWGEYTYPLNGCFPCNYNAEMETRKGKATNHCCPFCFLDWQTPCGRTGSLFGKWLHEKNLVVSEVLADLIATVPLKKGLKGGDK